MQIIPAVDVLDGRVVRLEQGRFDRVTVYGDDPTASVAALADAGASLVHVVDLDAARSGVPTPGIVAAIAATGVPFQFGGGIRSAGAAESAVAAGAGRVVIGSAAVWEPEVVEAIVERVGSERVVVAVDVEAGRARGSGWEDEGRDAMAVARQSAAAGAGRLLVTAVARDGTMAGPDRALLDTVARTVAVPIIASGGVGQLAHIAELAVSAVEAAVIGRALYEGRFTFAEALAAAQAR